MRGTLLPIPGRRARWNWTISSLVLGESTAHWLTTVVGDPAMKKAKLLAGCRATARNVRSLQRILDKMDA